MEYREHRYWSIIHGVRVARLSIADGLGCEHFAIVPTEAVRGDEAKVVWRDKRDDVLGVIAGHIMDGGQPGEVAIA